MFLSLEQISCLRQAILKKEITAVTFDTETSISKFYSFFAGKQYVDPKSQVDGTETKVMSAQFMYSLVGKPQYFAWDFNNGKGDDSEVVRNITSIINSADIVIGQNSESFDKKVLQERAKLLRLPPVKIDFPLDTLKLNRRSCRTISHSLDSRSKQYGLGGKHRMGREDWIDIVEGKVSVEEKMIPYGLKDVRDTDKVFWLDLPYYDLPKSTVSKILKLINWDKKTDCCPFCAANRQKKFDIYKKGKFGYCNNCEQKWELK